MKYQFSFYNPADYPELKELVLASYRWDPAPSFGLSRLEFSAGLHPGFTGHRHAWEQSIGLYRHNGAIVAAICNEGVHSGETFFFFDSPQRAEDAELVQEMIRFAKTYGAGVKSDGRTRYVDLHIPPWNWTLADMANSTGFSKNDWGCRSLVLPFDVIPPSDLQKPPQLPPGYSFADGRNTTAADLALVHRHSFGYQGDSHACKFGGQAFEDLRRMAHYRPDLDICILDEYRRPVAMATIWYDSRLPYCELEPMGVTWWNRRRGLGSALIREASRRVLALDPRCRGMLGGDQAFYSSLGFACAQETPTYHWELEVIISWEAESLNQDYASRI
ncbi:GNAT family N-acetyltransferase [Spirochaeta lutea]|uniref:GNAT family N-acetyltransferase n=1 Tax=Spirochaeta lutea TaxID=1480694 RepID=UPI00068E8B20|nr:GNAT family N-acetyltransferase [Spirochaeta lutea]